jgi:hypothetical protein
VIVKNPYNHLSVEVPAREIAVNSEKNAAALEAARQVEAVGGKGKLKTGAENRSASSGRRL